MWGWYVVLLWFGVICVLDFVGFAWFLVFGGDLFGLWVPVQWAIVLCFELFGLG